MSLKKHIPNAITCGNLLCGCLAIIQTFQGNLVWAAYLVGIAVVLDFFDGFAARALNVTSPIGKDLDSLADLVTFGVVPGLIMYHLIQMSLTDMIATDGMKQGWLIYPSSVTDELIKNDRRLSIPESIKYVALIIPVFSAIRLAKFNNDTRQSTSFIGLPTPANALLICSLPLILWLHFDYFYLAQDNRVLPLVLLQHHQEIVGGIILEPIRLAILAVVMAILLVVELPLFALKFKTFAWKSNELKYIFIILSIGLLIAFKVIAIPLIIILYLILSLVFYRKS